MSTGGTFSVKGGDVLVMVGTTKGAFLMRGEPRREVWANSGPHLRGDNVYAMNYDGRDGRRRIWAGSRNEHYAPELKHSDDFGADWKRPEMPQVQYPADTGLAVERIWQIERGADADTLYCGVAPAGLFVSRDAGESFSLVKGLHDHPHRAQWSPGGGGLCLHTILTKPGSPRSLLVAVSTGGVYRSEDAGETWAAANKGIRADFLPPERALEFGQCVHKVVRDATNPDRLYLQNHGGLYRSDDDGRTWKDVVDNLKNDFGFAMVAHPHQADTVYVIPLDSDVFRCTPEGKLRVFRSTTGGGAWRAMTQGLPQRDAHETVLRDALCTDGAPSAGLYFGTRSGKLYASHDDGESWRLIQDGLPPINCVKAAAVE